MSGDNPYSPPASVEFAPSDRFFWHVRGMDVIVRDRAILPEIDLETGIDQPPLTRSILIWAATHPTDRWMTFLGFLPIIFVVKLDPILSHFYLWLIIISCLFGGLIWRIRKRTRRFNISIFREVSRERIRQRGARIRTFLGLGALILITIAPVLLAIADVAPAWTPASISAGLVLLTLLIASAIAAKKENPVKLSPGPDGWTTLGPIHPDALAKLREIEFRHNRRR